MAKQRLDFFLDKLSEFSLYLILASIPFSVSLTETSVFFAISIFFIKKIINRQSIFRFQIIHTAILLFILWNVLSIFKSDYVSTSIRGAFKIVKFTLLFFAVFEALNNQRIFRNLIKITLFVSIIVSLDGLVQYIIGWDPIRHNYVDFLDNPRRISASFHHANDFGGYLILVIPIFLSILFSKSNNLKLKIGLISILFLLFICLLLTRSKGAWLGFTVAISLLGMLKGKRWFILFLIIFILIPILAVPQISGRIKSTFFDERGTTWERLKLWEGTIDMIKASPVIGLGVNTYSKNFPKYKPPDYPDVRYAHNSYLQMASEIGLVGLGIFLYIVFYVMLSVFRNIKHISPGWLKDAHLGIFCGLTGFLIHSGLDTHLYALVLAALFWFTLAILFKAPHILKEDAAI